LKEKLPAKVKVSLVGVAVLISNLYKAVRVYGELDAEKTMDMLLADLNLCLHFPASSVESALAYSNFLNEDGMWEHPKGMTFKEFITRCVFDNRVKFSEKENCLKLTGETK